MEYLETWAGWQEEVRRYWFLSVGFLYRSTTTLPSLIDREVSRKAMEVDLSQVQVKVLFVMSMGWKVWDRVNCID